MRLVLALALATLACSGPEPAPAAPVGGTGGGRIGAPTPGGASDGGTSPDATATGGGDGGDGGDAGTTAGCVAPIDGLTNRAVVTQGGVDRGFRPASAFATYTPAPCDSSRRELLLILSEDERCQRGVGRRLVFVVDESEVGAGLIPLGSPIQLAFSTALAARYIEPSAPATDGSVWGNCTDAADGDLTFERLDVGAADGRATATFEATLVDCSATGDEPPVQISGALDVPLAARFEDLCDPT